MGQDEREEGWEKSTVEALAWEGVKEQRRSRRWSVFFKLLTFAYLGFFLWALVDWPGTGDIVGKPHTALVELKGLIAEGADADAEEINGLLQSAFEDKNTKGVILEINSPGGTPVQAKSIYEEILRLREKYPEIKLYAVVSDLCASGGYYVAAAAEEIYASEASIVGSIGVRMDSFGFQKVMEKLGVERRTLTAGENKALLDPFAPQNPAQRAHLQGMLDQVHQLFINDVKAGRGDRLEDNDALFSGLIWSGKESLKLGLIDGFGGTDSVARDKIGEENVVTFSPKQTLLEQLTEDVGTGMVKALNQLWISSVFDKGRLY
ncbi:MAG: signal peptide peptidase SppA [Thiothrix sp.]|nr:MAG: signal peptide peptidase SppA [Thiothrix sp.]